MAGMPVRLATALTTPVSMESLMLALWDCKGSDLLITPGSAPILRLDGDLVRLDDLPLLTPMDTDTLLQSILTGRQLEEFRSRKELDFSFQLAGPGALPGQRVPAARQPSRSPCA